MSLIRNGGFERGTTDFWFLTSSGTLTVDNSNQKYGDYCGKYTAVGDLSEAIMSSDYISCNPGDLINISGWINTPGTGQVALYTLLYDSDYSYVTYQELGLKDATGSYQLLSNQLLIPDNIGYIRIGYELIHPDISGVYYLDSLSYNIITSDSALSGSVVLHEMSAETTNGDSSDDKKDMMQFSSYYGLLDVTAISGSLPTLNAAIHEIDEFGTDIVIGTFTQTGEVGEERIDLPRAQGHQMYAVWNISDTDPSFTFGISVIGKR